MQYGKHTSLFLAFLVVAVFCTAHFYIAPLVGEEARYASVAWQMFREHNWFIPHYGDGIYLEKSPFLFWCLNLGWWLKVDWPWQAILPAAFAMLTIFYTQKLAVMLFPEKKNVHYLAPLILVAMPFFMDNLGLLRFDMLLTFFNVLAAYCLMRSSVSRGYYWGFVFANGFGLLTKGPVIYIFTATEVILFCVYLSNKPIQDAIKFLTGILLSSVMLLAWWGPMIYQGHINLIHAMLFDQVVSRATGARGPAKPIWDYVSLLPCFFLPWMLFVPFLRARTIFGEREKDKKAALFLIQAFIICFILFSLIKTKEARYFLPVMPVLAIFIAHRLEKMQLIFFRQRYFMSTCFMGILLCLCAVSFYILLNYYPQKIHVFYAHYLSNVISYICFFIGVAMIVSASLPIKLQVTMLILASIFVSTTLELASTYAIAKTQDLSPAVKFINQLLAKNISVVSRDPVVLDMQFTGRWSTPVSVISNQSAFDAWAKMHSNAWVVITKESNKNIAYATMANGCFEQTYSHLRSIMQVCPASNFLTVT